MIQYPVFIVFRRAIDLEIDIEFWENIIRWTLMSCFVIWLPNKQLTPSTKTLVMASALALLVSGLVAYYQVKYLAYYRAGGTENPINFAAFLAIYICIIYFVDNNYRTKLQFLIYTYFIMEKNYSHF